MLGDWIEEADNRLCALGILKALSWDTALKTRDLKLYAGTIDRAFPQSSTHYGVTPFRSSTRNIQHDIRDPFPIPDNSVQIFQSEDVFEHLVYEDVPSILSEIHRVLRPGGLLRFSVPDYRCPILRDRSVKDENGKILFDPGGGGRFEDGKVVGGGHLWFPVYEDIKNLFDNSPFGSVQYLHYTEKNGHSVLNPIDYTLGNVKRTPDYDERAASPRIALSIVVDVRK